MKTTGGVCGWPSYVALGVMGLVLACGEAPTTPHDLRGPELSNVLITDSTRVLTVGVDAPVHLTLTGTVGGIVVRVDNAIVDLSQATVDCSGQSHAPDTPTIGVWVKNNSHVHVKGGSTGVIKNCNIGVLIGPPDPEVADLGGSANHIDGLVIPNVPNGQGLFWGSGIVLSNSHDNKVDHNNVSYTLGAVECGILVHGSDPGAALSGRNTISDNVLEKGFNTCGILVSSNGNVVRGNASTGPIEGIIVEQDSNVIRDNAISFFEGEDNIAFGIHLRAGADDNTITNNHVRAHDIGIVVDDAAFRNLITKNSATALQGTDAVDRSGACVNNTWTKNAFVTVDPTCIR